MGLICGYLDAFWNNHLFKAGDKYSLSNMVKGFSDEFPSVDNFDVGKPLPICPKGSPVKNAILDVKNFTLFGLQGFAGVSKSCNENDNIEAAADVTLSGDRVPAHPSDFVKGKTFGKVTNFGDGSPVTGPLSLDGISDFAGLGIKGDFSVTQNCGSKAGNFVANGVLMATVNNLEVKDFKIKVVIPASDPAQVQVVDLSIKPVDPAAITITLLRADGSLPPYNYDVAKTSEDLQFLEYQNVINFPPPTLGLNLFDQIASNCNSYLTNSGSNAKLRNMIAGKIADFINQYL